MLVIDWLIALLKLASSEGDCPWQDYYWFYMSSLLGWIDLPSLKEFKLVPLRSFYYYRNSALSEVIILDSRTYSGSKLLWVRLGIWGGICLLSITCCQLISEHHGWLFIRPICPLVILLLGSLWSINLSKSASLFDMNWRGYSNSR